MSLEFVKPSKEYISSLIQGSWHTLFKINILEILFFASLLIASIMLHLMPFEAYRDIVKYLYFPSILYAVIFCLAFMFENIFFFVGKISILSGRGILALIFGLNIVTFLCLAVLKMLSPHVGFDISRTYKFDAYATYDWLVLFTGGVFITSLILKDHFRKVGGSDA